MSSKRIFTFWEPREKMHSYLKLCIKTWQKFLPDYEIVILDYSNLDKWLGENFYPKNFYINFSLPKQADAIRCAVLKQYGGLWFDTDTIITSPKCRNILNTDSELVLFYRHIGFIVAKQNGYVLNKWEKKIQQRIWLYELCKKSKLVRNVFSLFKRKYRRLESWNYLGNSILDKILKNANSKQFLSIDRDNAKALPEIVWARENNINDDPLTTYRKFYFESDFSNYALHDNQGIICLHNSWTPDEYKDMSEKKFLSQNMTLSHILKHILSA
jgi:hypothetical protein